MITEVAVQEHCMITLQFTNCESSRKRKYMQEREEDADTKSCVQEKEKRRKGL